MSKPKDPEILFITRTARALVKLPVDAQLRALAFLSSSALGVGSWAGSEILYKASQRERERLADEAGERQGVESTKGTSK